MRIRTVIYVLLGLFLVMYLFNHRVTLINATMSLLDTSTTTEAISPDSTPTAGQFTKSAKGVSSALEKSRKDRYKEETLPDRENEVIDIFPGMELK